VPRQQFQQEYTREQVLRVANVSERQLRNWENAGLIEARESYSMSDLKAIQTLVRMRDARLGPKRIRTVFDEIRQKLSGVRNPATDVTVLLERGRVHVIVDGQRMEAISGQLLFNFDPQEVSRLLAFPKEHKSDRDLRQEKRNAMEAADWFQRGVEIEAAGLAVDGAIEAYEKALALDPKCVAAMVNLGNIYFHAKDWKRAEACYRGALMIEPDYALGHFNLANLHDEKGDLAEAALHYNAALRIAPNYADAHYNLALLCQSTGQIMKAVRHWQAYLKLDPASSWAEVARRELAKLRDAAVVRPLASAPRSQRGQHSPRVVS
jgi:tetratricopeptide (TPR) repeat protein